MVQTSEVIRDNIVKIVGENGNFIGTGFFIHKEYCVTCHHNICRLNEIYIEKEDKIQGEYKTQRYHAEWIEEFSDMQKDVAFLKVWGINIEPLQFRRETYGKIPVVVRGFPSQDLEHHPDGKRESGVLEDIDARFPWKEEPIAVEDEYERKKWNVKPKVDVRAYAFNGKFSVGFSGAPVCYEHDWTVVGMFEAQDETKGYIIPMHLVVGKFDLFEFFELAKAKRANLRWSDWTGLDARRTDIAGSYVNELVKNLLKETSPIDYAIFNLGKGKEWLSSRLYLFTRILQMTRGLRCVVFVDAHQEVRDRFVGIVEPKMLRYALAEYYPWLEMCFAKAYADTQALEERSIFTSINGSVDKDHAVMLVSNFLNQPEIQYSPDLPKQQNVPKDLEKEWVNLGTDNFKKWEHAEWLDTRKVEEQILKEVPYRKLNISKSWIIRKSAEDQLRGILSFRGPFVAVLEDDNEHFYELYDKQRLSEEVAHRLILTVLREEG